VPPEPPIVCHRCRKSVPYGESIYLSANWSDTREYLGGRKLITCRPCSEPVVDALRAVLEPRRERPDRRPQAGAADGPPIWEVVARIGESIPLEELEHLPRDVSRNLDHYLYGAPKKDDDGSG
jgi:hypothetical protein